MTKENLEVGMMVEFRRGLKSIIKDIQCGKIYFESINPGIEDRKIWSICLENLTNDLCYIPNNQIDIIKVEWTRMEETPEQKELKEIEEKQREFAEEQKRLADRIRKLNKQEGAIMTITFPYEIGEKVFVIKYDFSIRMATVCEATVRGYVLLADNDIRVMAGGETISITDVSKSRADLEARVKAWKERYKVTK